MQTIYTYLFNLNSDKIANLFKNDFDQELIDLIDSLLPEKADKYINHNVYYNQSAPMVVNVVKPEHLYVNIMYNAVNRPGRSLFVNGKMVLEGYNTENMEEVTKRVQDDLSRLDVENMPFSIQYN